MDRRRFLKTGAGVAVAAALIDRAVASETSVDGGEIAGLLARKGHQAVPSADLITGHAFNAGVRYDDTLDYFSGGTEPQKWFVVQDCARVEDIAVRDQPNVLAYFHILAFVDNAPPTPGDVFRQGLEFLTGTANLDPGRLTLVMSERGKPYLELAAQLGISQVVTRSLEEAQAAGDGSGFFSPKGHPSAPALHTVSVHYALQENVPPNLQYPLQDQIELGEFAFGGSQEGRELFGLGLERLAMAQGKPGGDFLSSRDMLLKELEADANRRNVTLPEAYELFSKL